MKITVRKEIMKVEERKTSTIINRLLQTFTSKAIFHTPEWISKNVKENFKKPIINFTLEIFHSTFIFERNGNEEDFCSLFLKFPPILPTNFKLHYITYIVVFMWRKVFYIFLDA